jgi:hypothetical protein
MKKIKFIIITFIILFIFISAKKSYAYPCDGVFNGTITPKHDFMVGDCVNNDDFIIEGTIEHNGKTYSIKDANFSLTNSIENERTNKVEGCFIIEQPETFATRVFIDVNYIPFSSKLSFNYENIEVSTGKTDFKMSDAVGRKIDGRFNFSKNYYSPRLGYNYISYTFTPYLSRYETTSGNFILYNSKRPNISVYKDKLYINIDNSDNAYKIKVNNKIYDSSWIRNLKPNTKYKITIIQNATEYNKEKMVYSTTVKTKSR